MDSPLWWNNRLWHAPDFVTQSKNACKPPLNIPPNNTEFDDSVKLHWNSSKGSANHINSINWLNNLTSSTPKLRPASPISRIVSPGRNRNVNALRVAYTSRPVSATFRPDSALFSQRQPQSMMVLGQNPFLSASNSRQGSQENLTNISNSARNFSYSYPWKTGSLYSNHKIPNKTEIILISPRLKTETGFKTDLQINGESRPKMFTQKHIKEPVTLKRSNSLPLKRKEDNLPDKTPLLSLRQNSGKNKFISYGFKNANLKIEKTSSNDEDFSKNVQPMLETEKMDLSVKKAGEVPQLIQPLVTPTASLKLIPSKNSLLDSYVTTSNDNKPLTKQELLKLTDDEPECEPKEAWNSEEILESSDSEKVTEENLIKLHSHIKKDLSKLENEITDSKNQLEYKLEDTSQDVLKPVEISISKPIKINPKNLVVYVPRSVVVESILENSSPKKPLPACDDVTKTVVNIPINCSPSKEIVKPILKRNHYSSHSVNSENVSWRNQLPLKSNSNVTDCVWKEIFKVEGHHLTEMPDATELKISKNYLNKGPLNSCLRPYSAFQPNNSRCPSPNMRKNRGDKINIPTSAVSEKRRGVRFDMRSISVMEFHPGDSIQSLN